MSDARGFSLLERFELKYHIPVEWADRIARFIAPYCEEDHFSQITPGGFYWITNLTWIPTIGPCSICAKKK